MPVIQNADLTTVNTKADLLPEGNYTMVVTESEMNEKGNTLIVKHKVVGGEHDGREYWNWINLVQNDGKPNRVGAIQIKRYMEAAFGEGSAEAENSAPDTDILNGHMFNIFLKARSYTPKGETEEKHVREVKLITAA